MAKYDKKTIEELIDGTIDFFKLKEMLSSFKDPERFDTYLSILQERVPWDDQILLPAGLHLYIVQKKNGDRIVKCDCGHEFCDYRDNWKLHALIYVRDTEEKMEELYPKLLAPDPEWQVIREYYCPSCATQLEVENVTPWYPVIKDFEPDIDAFYEEWLGRPVPQP
ncbi:acetone carboxylase subunit gamma [Collibacillus ludicampi]|jgi:acetone carboxylase, gamma subunit|uniref:Acetone carboxylase subunit gamma n=1 Tax=Collibacillus ludicampi TaxID=2771369 RepID=A0AAV4LI38_9BACL|nr:acetone carboxylase subunit gamma [Collibacillus ludicampi]GIM47474.1 acetone carboxylase subunit gamma [Collibacillus ludicampi]